MTIADRIFSLLRQQNKTQAALANYLDVREATISQWKAKKISPSTEHLEKISDFFGVSVDYLVTGHEPAAVVNQGIFGNQNTHNTITINGDAPRSLSDIELELLRICENLDIRRKTELLTYAYKLENKEN